MRLNIIFTLLMLMCTHTQAQRAMVDAARLADELRIEQDTAMALERDKKLLECQASILFEYS